MNHSHLMSTASVMDHNHHGHMTPSMINTTMNMHDGHDMNHDHDHDHGDNGDGSGMDHSNMTMHSMQMYFHTGVMEYILLEGLHTHDVGGLVGACFAMFVLSLLYEGLKYFREFLLRRASARQRYIPSSVDGKVTTQQPEIGVRMLSGSHGIQTLLHMVQVFVSYCLMLVFMTYNVWLCLSIIIGAGLGYFLFGWRRALVVDINEHCH